MLLNKLVFSAGVTLHQVLHLLQVFNGDVYPNTMKVLEAQMTYSYLS